MTGSGLVAPGRPGSTVRAALCCQRDCPSSVQARPERPGSMGLGSNDSKRLLLFLATETGARQAVGAGMRPRSGLPRDGSAWLSSARMGDLARWQH